MKKAIRMCVGLGLLLGCACAHDGGAKPLMPERFSADLKAALAAADEKSLETLFPASAAFSAMDHAGEGQQQKPVREYAMDRQRFMADLRRSFAGKEAEIASHANGPDWVVDATCHGPDNYCRLEVILQKDAGGAWQVRRANVLHHGIRSK